MSIMKNLIIIVIFLSILTCCKTLKNTKTNNKGVKIEQIEKPKKPTEYELIVLDTKFETFLLSQPSMNFYSNEYYRNYNILYVTEWNIRYSSPSIYGDFYETYIDYDPNINYNIELNYKLYYYFKFIEKEYGIKLIQRY